MAVALLPFTLSLGIIHRVRLFAQPLKMKTLVIVANAATACQMAIDRVSFEARSYEKYFLLKLGSWIQRTQEL